MTGSGGGSGTPNTHMGQPSYPGQGIFSKNISYSLGAMISLSHSASFC